MKNAENIEDWPIIKSSGVSTAYQFGPDGLQLIHGADDDTGMDGRDFTALCVTLWRRVSPAFDAHHLVVTQGSTTCVVSGHGSLAFFRPSAINLGLLFGPLSRLPFQASTGRREPAPLATVGDSVLWQVLERLARCEMPRRLQFEISDLTLVFDAAANGFDLVSGADTLALALTQLRDHAEAGAQARYTMTDAPKAITGQYDLTGALAALGASTDTQWKVTAGNWPTAYPPNTRIDELGAVVQLAADLSQPFLKGSDITLKAYGDARNCVCEGTFSNGKYLELQDNR